MNRYALLWVLVTSMFLGACGGGGGGGSGGNNPPPPPPPPPPPANTTDFSVTLTNAEAFLAVAPVGSASASFTLNEDDNTLSGTVTLSNVSADTVTLNSGFAGEVGTLLLELDSDSATSWSIPDDTELSDAERDDLEAGHLYVLVTDSANPDGVLRGQILPAELELLITNMSADEIIPSTGSSATATGFMTLNSITGDIIVRAVTSNFADANAAHIHLGVAGVDGAPLVFLTQNSVDSSLWSNAGNQEVLDSAGLDALNAGALYFNFHSPTFPGGEIRGQIIPANIEVTLTALDGDSVVVPGSSGVTTTASAIAATTFNAVNDSITTHLHTVDLDDALSATLNQAPDGQNGPAIANFVQDGVSANVWSALDVNLSPSQIAALQNQGLYFTVTTPANPDGEVRGQFVPASSSAGNSSTFQVTAIAPANAEEVDAFPDNIVITFNRNVLDTSLAADTISITASGGDGSFGEANDQAITGFGSSIANNTLSVDLSGIVVADDIFQIALADGDLTDSGGVILDGDNDDAVGGVFASTFNVVTPPTPPNPDATFSAIQTNVFTPRCTGCHGGGAPLAGMSLEAGLAFNNLVNVTSGQVSLLRVDPNNPDDSYLIRKLEGGPGITGARMPFGGPFLSQDVIDDIREWISAGAQNN